MTDAAAMSSNNLPRTPEHQVTGSGASLLDHPQVQLGVFAATLFGSALLLFSVQPMFAKMALPKLGGSPSVWAVSMCFFQAALLAGYCYAHGLNRWLTPRLAVFAHLTLMAITLMALPIAIPTSLGEPPAGDAYVWLLGVLAAGVGLPFFTVAANAPLLQAWFARTGHPQAKDPYFLYGASNLGSLIALLAYPLLIEPAIGLQSQTKTWSLGFMLLGALIAASGTVMIWMMARNTTDGPAGQPERPAHHVDSGQMGQIQWSDRLLWIGLALVPSGLMVGVTTYITTDLAASPFLWVFPLALFLTTFIVVFRERVALPYTALVIALPFVILAQIAIPGRWERMGLAVLGFFIASLICHRELYLRRPAASHLTEFYIWMSAGGVVGGVFAALIAPQLFTSVFEFSILMVAALFCCPGVLLSTEMPQAWRRIGGLACLSLAAVVFEMVASTIWGLKGQQMFMFTLVLALGIVLWLTRDWAERRAAFMLGIATVSLTFPDQLKAIYTERSFFGTVRVIETTDGESRMMLHGTTMHGARRFKQPDGTLVPDPVPSTYYHAATPMGRGVEAARRAKSATAALASDASDTNTPILVGVVGLGTGSLACYAKAGDAFRFFEIDPVIVRVAKNPNLFDYLSRCAPRAPIVVGDARLTLAKEPNEAFDYLVIDAFSSDTVPVHLMTVEALQLYLTKMSETGIIALHISNRYLDLVNAVSSTISQLPDVNAALVKFNPRDEDKDANASNVILLSRSAKALEFYPGVARRRRPATNQSAPLDRRFLGRPVGHDPQAFRIGRHAEIRVTSRRTGSHDVKRLLTISEQPIRPPESE